MMFISIHADPNGFGEYSLAMVNQGCSGNIDEEFRFRPDLDGYVRETGSSPVIEIVNWQMLGILPDAPKAIALKWEEAKKAYLAK